jgi:small GTP-binding protein
MSPDPFALPEYKVVLVGDAGVGKTSLIVRYHQNKFFEDQVGTIGSAFIRRQVTLAGRDIILSVWDTAGQERYRSLIPMYARGSYVAIIVFDLSEPATFDGLGEWIAQIQSAIPTCALVFAGSKCDLPGPDRDNYEQWAVRNGYEMMFVSAKTGQCVSNLFDLVINQLPKAMPTDSVNLAEPEKEEGGNGCC